MKSEIRRLLPVIIGFSLSSIYQLVKDYIDKTMNIYDIIINVVLLIIGLLIIKDIWKYGD